MDITDIEKLVQILKSNDITEFEYDKDGTKLRFTRGVAGQVVVSGAVQQQAVMYQQPGAFQAPAPAASEAPSDASFKVESPIVGTFYRKPSPDAEVFCKEGDSVRKGQTLCIVEAMKLMNEIEAPISGKIKKICLSEGQVVEYGEVLFLIDPEG